MDNKKKAGIYQIPATSKQQTNVIYIIHIILLFVKKFYEKILKNTGVLYAENTRYIRTSENFTFR